MVMLDCINRVQHVPVVKQPLDKDQPSVEQILAHLDHMRSACKDISCTGRLISVIIAAVNFAQRS